jgi:quinoprotein glucose dehydrogenase
MRLATLFLITAALVCAQQPGRGGRGGRGGGMRVKMAADSTVPGDVAHGRAIFEGKGECLKCHRVGTQGSRLGPDLTDIANQRTLEDLQKSVTDPSPEARPQNQLYRVVTKDGATVTGKIMNQDTSSVQMLDSNERLVSYQKSNLRSFGPVQPPPMPSYRGKLSDEELTDLIAYLVSLKGASTQ